MKIEEEIRQKKFQNSYQRVAVNLMFTSGWLATYMTRQLRPYGITQQQYNVLRILRGQNPEPASVGLIQERMIDRSSNASRLVDKLHDKGLAIRRTCKKDRRQVDIVITQKGLDLLAELDEQQNFMNNNPIHLTEAEADQLSDLLDKLRS
jgi:DNA-binding MarR family transcriptional regulator